MPERGKNYLNPRAIFAKEQVGINLALNGLKLEIRWFLPLTVVRF